MTETDVRALTVEDAMGAYRAMEPTWLGLTPEPSLTAISETFKRMQGLTTWLFVELAETRTEIALLRRSIHSAQSPKPEVEDEIPVHEIRGLWQGYDSIDTAEAALVRL